MRKDAVHSSNSERSRPSLAQYSESSSGVASSRRRQSETESNGPGSVDQSRERAGSQSRPSSKRRSSSIASQLNEGRSSAQSPLSPEGRSSTASQQQEVAKTGSEGGPTRSQKDRADSGPKKKVPPSPLRNVLSSNDVEPERQGKKIASSDERTPSAPGRRSETSQAQQASNPGSRSRAGTGKTEAGRPRTSTLRPALSSLTEEKVKKVEGTPKAAEEEDSDEERSSAFVRNEEAERERLGSTVKTMMNRRIGVMERSHVEGMKIATSTQKSQSGKQKTTATERFERKDAAERAKQEEMAKTTIQRGIGDMRRTNIEAMVEKTPDDEFEEREAMERKRQKSIAKTQMHRGIGDMERTHYEGVR